LRVWSSAVCLSLLFLSLAASPAVAQPSYVYESCVYRMGLFLAEDSYDEEHTNIDYEPQTVFVMHLVLLDAVGPVAAYEVGIDLDPAFVVIDVSGPAGAPLLNLGTGANLIVGFAEPLVPDDDGRILLGTIRVFPQTANVASNIALGPSRPSSVGGDGPAIVVDGVLIRTNFTPLGFDGCDDDLPPGLFPPAVATTFGDGVPLR
jgi:hypothetical protein